jgi:hypothetical protein
MGLKMSRRNVYIATVVAILAMAGGFALAAGFSGFSPTGGLVNAGTFTTQNTMYAGTGSSQSIAVTTTTTGTCTSSGATGVAPGTIYIAGSVACDSTTSAWVEELTFVPATAGCTAPANCDDTFSFYGLVSGTPYTVVVDQASLGTTTVVFALYLGVSTAQPTATGSINVVVTETQS